MHAADHSLMRAPVVASPHLDTYDFRRRRFGEQQQKDAEDLRRQHGPGAALILVGAGLAGGRPPVKHD
jgi:hypothetical protein